MINKLLKKVMEIDSKIILSESELTAIKMSMYAFKHIETKGYEHQYERLVLYLWNAKPSLVCEEFDCVEYELWLYDDEKEIIEMCLEPFREVKTNA